MIIIDGHNLIGSFYHLKFEDEKVYEKIFEKLDKYNQLFNTKIILVFDGFDKNNFNKYKNDKINVIFSNQRKADYVINNLCKKFSHAKDTIIVSSDNEIKSNAKKNNLIIKNSKIFAREIIDAENSLNNISNNKEYLNPIETEKWLEYFNKK